MTQTVPISIQKPAEDSAVKASLERCFGWTAPLSELKYDVSPYFVEVALLKSSRKLLSQRLQMFTVFRSKMFNAAINCYCSFHWLKFGKCIAGTGRVSHFILRKSPYFLVDVVLLCGF